MRPLSEAVILVVLVLAAGCTQDNRVAPLEGKVASLEAKTAALEKRMEELNFQVSFQASSQGWDRIAYLTPGTDGYSAVKMDLGYLTVNLADIAPYANGSKVTLTFGNLTSATIDGLKAKIEWGPVDEKGLPKGEQGKSREISLAESLYPGAWNKTDVVLEGVPPTALGFVRLKDISHRGIRLRGSIR
jgi:outer membrane murein-binding lipoprotein Lpp